MLSEHPYQIGPSAELLRTLRRALANAPSPSWALALRLAASHDRATAKWFLRLFTCSGQPR